MNTIIPWDGPEGIRLPANIDSANELVPYSKYFTPKQKEGIIKAFEQESYDIGVEFIWKKAMTKLKETLSLLGPKFIGEMIEKNEVDDDTPIENMLTDYMAIDLAIQIGIISHTAAINLRHCNEIITHYFSRKAIEENEEISKIKALDILQTTIQYILGQDDITIAVRFSVIRDRLINETFNINDDSVQEILDYPLFFLRTIITVLLFSIKNNEGAKLENSLANFNLLIPLIWEKLSESDKYKIGDAYRDVVSSGNSIAASGLKSALLKIKGFDYVPETLRSNTFKKYAKLLLDTHFDLNNYYNEPPVVRRLASLGSIIPSNALAECMQALLAVYLGNSYGYSYRAADIAKDQLSLLTKERWNHYFKYIIHDDMVILIKLFEENIVNRFNSLLITLNLTEFDNLPKNNQTLYNGLIRNNYNIVYNISQKLYLKIN